MSRNRKRHRTGPEASNAPAPAPSVPHAWEPMTEIPAADPGFALAGLLTGRTDGPAGVPFRVFRNARYLAGLFEFPNGEMLLNIHPRTTVLRDWREFQQIKNELCGPAREACELYPSEDRLVDVSNVFHLSVLPAGVRFPCGFHTRRVRGPEGPSAAPQRPFGPPGDREVAAATSVEDPAGRPASAVPHRKDC